MTAIELARWLLGCDPNAEVGVVVGAPKPGYIPLEIRRLLYAAGEDGPYITIGVSEQQTEEPDSKSEK